MDEATVTAIMGLATAALPFAAAGVVWLKKKLNKAKADLKISNEQGDLIIAGAKVLVAVFKSHFANDAAMTARIAKAEEILTKMVSTWDDDKGTTEVLNGYMKELEAALRAT